MDDMSQTTDANLEEEVRKCYRSVLDAEEQTSECERTHDSVRRKLYGDLSRESSFHGSFGRLDSKALLRMSRSETALNDSRRSWRSLNPSR